MKNDRNEIIKAFWTLGDYFSRLGGAARYFNMPESDIALYIACQLAHKHSSEFEPMDFISRQFIEVALPILQNVHSHLDLVNSKGDELAFVITDFMKYANSKLKLHDRSAEWNRFSEWCNHTYARQSSLLNAKG